MSTRKRRLRKPATSKQHIDGSKCPEGTQRLPPRFSACCEAFEPRTLACSFDVRYEWWPKKKNWFVVIAESAGGGGIAIAHCPHCGTELAGGKLSGRWMDV